MADGVPEAIDGSSGRFSQMRFQLGEGHLDRVEVHAVGRKDWAERLLPQWQFTRLAPYGWSGYS